MRDHIDPQSHLYSYFSPEKRVPAGYPLRSIKAYAESALKQFRPVLDVLCSEIGRPPIPPQRLLKAQLVIALYPVRSDRLFCETLDYNILFRWFLDMTLHEASLDASTFSKNREHLARENVALKFFDAVVREARRLELLADEHFSVDGTLIVSEHGIKCFGRAAMTGAELSGGAKFHRTDRRKKRRAHMQTQYRVQHAIQHLRQEQAFSAAC
jgi:transposase